MGMRALGVLLATLLLVGVFGAPQAEADEPVPSIPVFLRAELQYPTPAGGPRQKALKDGDSTLVIVTIDNTVVTTVTADLSALGGSSNTVLTDVNDYIDSNTGPNLLRQFQSEFFLVASGGLTGSGVITFTATDANGVVTTKAIVVVLDQSAPTLTVDAITRTSTSSLVQFDTLSLSGTLSGTGSGVQLYNIREQEIAADGSTKLYESWYNGSHPASLELLALAGGAFSSVPLRLYTASGAMTFPADVAFVRFVFDVRDDAGNLLSATSSLVSLAAPPPVPVGPQISNVLFLPGIKGSRLYNDDINCGVISCDNKLWDPGSSEDIQSLFLNPFGKSARTGVYTKEGDVIDKVDKKYYDSFIRDMNELQASSTYNGGKFVWRAAAYDWRLSLDDIITNGAKHDEKIYYGEATTSTPYIEQTLKELANKSTTGKVTIIAHSNGGLVTKALLSKLGSEETARLVDKIIFVGVPQTGAPQALGGLLFGEGEGLPKDKLPFIVSLATARTLAENSPMAYHLMPSARYLSDVQDSRHSVIGFSGEILYPKEHSFYGPSIDTLTELDNFLLAVDGGRSKPDVTDSTSANVLNSFLIDYANSTHAALDAWVPPASVTLYQVAGWGADTISGIDFYDEQKLLGVNIGYKKQYRPIFVEDGDGVVPVPSALMMSAGGNVKRYWFDLARQATDNGKKDHGDILESNHLREFIQNILQDRDLLPKFISTSQPAPIPGSRLVFQLHSPLTLGLYDSSGNFTGLKPDGSVSESIPGAQYGEFGEVKYLIAPAGHAYQLVMLGQSAGTFSLDIQEQTGNTVTSSATIAGVPTTASTIAKLTITNGVADASSLRVDTDGNGAIDTTLSAQVGKTVNYAPPVSTTSESSSGSKKTPVTTASEVVKVALAPFIPTTKLVTSVPPVLKATLTRAAPIETVATTSQTQTVASPSVPELPQTASAYSAFSSIAEWTQELMYTLWQGFTIYLGKLTHLFGIYEVFN